MEHASVGLVEPAPREGADFGRPITPLGQERQPPHALDDEGAPRLQGRPLARQGAARPRHEGAPRLQGRPLARQGAARLGQTLARLAPF
jgi:hypothetical protein